MDFSTATKVLRELGLVNLYQSPRDAKILIVQRFVRLFAYGSSTLVLVSYLTSLGISDSQIGLFMTLTMMGDVAISFALTLITDGVGRRLVLALGATSMFGSGLAFGLVDSYWILLFAAIVGVISPNGNEIGPFRAIEESTLAHLSSQEARADVFAWYSLFGTLGTAAGMLTTGWTVQSLQSGFGLNIVQTYRVVFLAYAVMGLVKLGLTALLSNGCEIQKPKDSQGYEQAPIYDSEDEDEATTPRTVEKPKKKSLLQPISRESWRVCVILALLFGLDSFGSSISPLSWIVNYFKRQFGLRESYLGSIFSTTSVISAISVLVAASVARRIGNIKTMVFTHLPSSAALAMLGLPGSLPIALALLVFRASTQSMDVAPRSAFLADVLLPNERTAIMGAINVVKTGAASLGPIITGFLVERDLFWVAFFTAGSLKVSYDLSILAFFLNYKRREGKNASEQYGIGDDREADDEGIELRR